MSERVLFGLVATAELEVIRNGEPVVDDDENEEPVA